MAKTGGKGYVMLPPYKLGGKKKKNGGRGGTGNLFRTQEDKPGQWGKKTTVPQKKG